MQDVFKKAAYLSTGSVDSRPTFQRDAVDDDTTGSGMGGMEGINAISWKDMHLVRGPLLGAAYGSLVMPQFKGGRRADRQKKLPNLVQDVSCTFLQAKILNDLPPALNLNPPNGYRVNCVLCCHCHPLQSSQSLWC